MMRTSVIIPARNEEVLIKRVVLDVYKYLKKKRYSFEIIVIANGCNDNTEKIVRKLTRKFSQIILIISKPGYGYALRKGLEKASGDYIVIFNVDFYDLVLIDYIDIDLAGKDIIIGSKSTYWANDKRPAKRAAVTKMFNFALKVLFNFRGSDTHGIKIIKSHVVKKVLPMCLTESGIFDTELVIRSQQMGYKIMDYPVEIAEKRPPRFSSRLIQTPIDIYNLHRALNKK